MKFLVVGAGAQGAPAASILSRYSDVSEVVLADIDEGLLEKVSEKIGSDKITAIRVDAGNLDELVKVAEGVDAVVNLSPIRFNHNIMKAALMSGAHYVDAATGPTLWDQILRDEPLELDKEFREAGLTAVFGSGGTPGVTNVLIRHGCDKLDKVDRVSTIVGFEPIQEAKEVVEAWDPGWSPETALEDWVLDAIVFEDGEYKHYPAFSGMEEYEFPEPLGRRLICWHIHDEALTIPRFIGKGVKYADFKYSVDKTAGALIKLGLAGADPIDVRGVKVAPRDVLLSLVRRPVNDFLNEDENTATAPFGYAGFLIIEIEGEKNGEKTEITLTYDATSQSAEERLEMFRKLGTVLVGVAAPAIVAAKMSIEGQAERGVIAPECLDPAKFFTNLAEMGVPIKFQETISRNIDFPS